MLAAQGHQPILDALSECGVLSVAQHQRSMERLFQSYALLHTYSVWKCHVRLRVRRVEREGRAARGRCAQARPVIRRRTM